MKISFWDTVSGAEQDVSQTKPLPVQIPAGSMTAPTPPATGTQTNVNDTNVAGTILAANANRKGASIWNDSTSILYLLLSATGTVSATLCTVKVAPDGYYEVPFGYTGIITGIWSADASGAARVTEWTP